MRVMIVTLTTPKLREEPGNAKSKQTYHKLKAVMVLTKRADDERA